MGAANIMPMMKSLLKIIVLLAGMALGFVLLYLLAIPLLMLLHSCDWQTALFYMSSVSGLRMVQSLQAVFVFVMPVFLMLRIFKTDASTYLSLKKTSVRHFCWALLSVFLMTPCMNAVVSWNESLHLPESMAGIEAWMRLQEAAAAAVTDKLLADTSLGGLLLNLIVMALLTGFAEELFFRGAIQRMLQGESDKTPHVAIWVTAFLFSAIHLQFYGFFPRMLMGLWLGYLLVWSGSIWVPMAAHALNNALVVLGEYAVSRQWIPENFGENIGTGPGWWLAVLSVLAMIVLTLHLSDSKFSFKQFFSKRA